VRSKTTRQKKTFRLAVCSRRNTDPVSISLPVYSISARRDARCLYIDARATRGARHRCARADSTTARRKTLFSTCHYARLRRVTHRGVKTLAPRVGSLKHIVPVACLPLRRCDLFSLVERRYSCGSVHGGPLKAANTWRGLDGCLRVAHRHFHCISPHTRLVSHARCLLSTAACLRLPLTHCTHSLTRCHFLLPLRALFLAPRRSIYHRTYAALA